MHVTCCWAMLGGESYHNVGIFCADWCRTAVGKIDAAIRQSDVVDNPSELGRRYLVANLGFHAVTQGGRLFNTHTGRGTKMQCEFATVHGWEEILSQPWVQPEGEHACSEKCAGKNTAVTDTGLEQSAIRGTNLLKAAFKPSLKEHERVLAWGVRAFSGMSSEKIFGHGWNESPRKHVRSQHREDDRLCHGYEEITGDPGEQKHGHKDDADAKC